MLTLPPAVRVYLATAPVDLRRGFDALAAVVRQTFGEDPLTGHLFVFRNKPGDKVKILFWDRNGFWLLCKRLKRGVFHFPDAATPRLEIEAAELALILEGIDLRGAKRRARFTPDAHLRRNVSEAPI